MKQAGKTMFQDNFKMKGGMIHSDPDDDPLNILYIHLSKINSKISPGGNDKTLLERHYQFFPCKNGWCLQTLPFHLTAFLVFLERRFQTF